MKQLRVYACGFANPTMSSYCAISCAIACLPRHARESQLHNHWQSTQWYEGALVVGDGPEPGELVQYDHHYVVNSLQQPPTKFSLRFEVSIALKNVLVSQYYSNVGQKITARTTAKGVGQLRASFMQKAWQTRVGFNDLSSCSRIVGALASA